MNWDFKIHTEKKYSIAAYYIYMDNFIGAFFFSALLHIRRYSKVYINYLVMYKVQMHTGAIS